MTQQLDIPNIADLDADIFDSVHGAYDIAALMTKWVKPLPDILTKQRYARYITERIHDILMSELT